jgi:hypothetical protein
MQTPERNLKPIQKYSLMNNRCATTEAEIIDAKAEKTRICPTENIRLGRDRVPRKKPT